MRKKKATREPQHSSPRGRRHALRRRLARCTEAAGELAEAGGGSSDAASGIAGGAGFGSRASARGGRGFGGSGNRAALVGGKRRGSEWDDRRGFSGVRLRLIAS